MSHKVSVREAALLAGKARETINQATRDGVLSCTLNERGHKVIDIAELERVFPLVLKPEELPASGAVRPAPANVAGQSDLRQELAVLRERLEATVREQESSRNERERERRQLEAEIEHLRASLLHAQEQHGKAMLLLTHQRGEEGAGGSREHYKDLEEAVLRLRKQNHLIYRELQATKARPFWRRLFR